MTSITVNFFLTEENPDSYDGAIHIRIDCIGDHAVRIGGDRPFRLLDTDAGNAGDDNGRRWNDQGHVASQSAAGSRERLLLSAICG